MGTTGSAISDKPATTQSSSLSMGRNPLKLYRRHGFEGLVPKRRTDRGTSRRRRPEVVDVLLELKEQNPKFTVKQVIASARSHSAVPHDSVLPESTVHRLLHRSGLMEKSRHEGDSKVELVLDRYLSLIVSVAWLFVRRLLPLGRAAGPWPPLPVATNSPDASD
ncbi:MAG: hypothetical protein AAF654_07755 [Myxococcota bacterium]